MLAEFKWLMHHIMGALRRSVTARRADVFAWIRFWNSYKEYKRLAPQSLQPALETLYPCVGDDSKETQIEPTYFYQDTWAFERITQRSPHSHVDVGSHHMFVAFLSKIVPVTMVDIRPLSLPLESLYFRQGSILSLPFEDGTVSSLSSLCVVEHIGLGRYGDPLDPQGTEKAIRELKRILAPGGHLYMSIPVSDVNVVHFNAGRILTLQYFFDLLEPFQVVEQAYIVGSSLQVNYEHRTCFATTALFDLMKPL